MAKKNLKFGGLPLFRFPSTGKDKVNNMNRNVEDLGSITSARLFYESGLLGSRSILFCGKINKAMPILRYYVRIIDRPVVLLTPDDFYYERTGLRLVFDDYSISGPSNSLPEGNGNVFVRDDEASMELIRMITENADRAFVFCAADGLQISDGILNALARTGSYFIITDMLRGASGDGIEVQDIVDRAKVLLFYPTADAERFLVPVLPKYECERPRNSLSFGYHSLNGNMPDTDDILHTNRGFGLNMSQSRELSVEPVINEAQLRTIRENGQILVYNTDSQRVYVGRISR